MKKIIMFAMSLILSVSLFVGCSNIESDLYDAIDEYTGDVVFKICENAINEEKDPSTNIAIKLIEETTFKITDIDIKDNTAEATVEVTGKNYSRVLYTPQAIAIKNCPLYAHDKTVE